MILPKTLGSVLILTLLRSFGEQMQVTMDEQVKKFNAISYSEAR